MSQYDDFFKKAKAVKRGAPAPRKPVAKTERRRREPFPLKVAGGLIVTLAIGATYLVWPEAIDAVVSRIEIGAIGSVRASEAETANAQTKEPAKTADAALKKAHGEGPVEGAADSSEFSQFEKLKHRKEELDRREKELGELEEELQRQKGELDQRIQTLEATRDQIAKILKDRVEVDQEKVNKLVDLYSNMKAKQAAEVIGSMNEDLAVEVLAKMKKKSAAEIMNLLPPEKARLLSEKYTGFKRTLAGSKG